MNEDQKRTDADELGDESSPKRRGRPPKAAPEPEPAPVTKATAAPKATVAPKAAARPNLRQRLAQAVMTRGRRAAMNPAELQTASDRRLQEVTAVLEAYNHGRTHRPLEYIEQMRFEAKHLLAGTWFPGIQRPKGRQQDTDAILGAPTMPFDAQALANEARVDALLES